jgi:hypothetical protein
MFVRAFSLCPCVGSALRRVDHSSKESYRLRKKDYETEEEARAQHRAVEPLMNERINNNSSCIPQSLGAGILSCPCICLL